MTILRYLSISVPSDGTEVVQVVPNWWYRNGTGGGPEHDIAFRVVPKWTGTETDHPVVPKLSGTERDLPLLRVG